MNEHEEDLDVVEQRVRRRIGTEGIEAAVEAAIDVLRDPKAPAPAKATMVTAMLRSAGLFKDRDEGAGEDARAQMPIGELQAAVRRCQRELDIAEKQRAERLAGADLKILADDDDVFG